MKTLRILYLEDDQKEAKKIFRWMEDSWNALKRGIPISVAYASSLDEAKQWLSANAEKCDLFLVDLSLKGNDASNVEGVEAIRHVVRHQYFGIGMIVISQTSPVSVRKAMEAGAHGYLSKDVICNSYEDAYVLREMERTLQTVGKIPFPIEDITVTYDRRDLRLESLVQAVGEETLKVLVLTLVNGMQSDKITQGMIPISEIRPAYVRPGLSGAVVLCVEVVYSKDGGLDRRRTEKLLLKCDRDLGRLQTEFRNERRLHRLAQSLRIEYVSLDPKDVHSSGWYACANQFRKNATDLAGWIQGAAGKPRNKASIERCLQNLFLSSGGLGSVYAETARAVESNRAHDEHVGPVRIVRGLSDRRRALAMSAVSELDPLAGKLKEKIDTRAIRSFVEEYDVGSRSARTFVGGAVECWNHGDFHARNVLVDIEREEPTVIDPAEIDWGYVGTDVARLCVDLFVSVADAGVKEYFWEDFGAWRTRIRSFLENPNDWASSAGSLNKGVATALSWLRRNWSKITENQVRAIEEWEFRLLMAVEFIRFATYFSVSMPKRVLSLACAGDAIALAEKVIPDAALRPTKGK